MRKEFQLVRNNQSNELMPKHSLSRKTDFSFWRVLSQFRAESSMEFVLVYVYSASYSMLDAYRDFSSGFVDTTLDLFCVLQKRYICANKICPFECAKGTKFRMLYRLPEKGRCAAWRAILLFELRIYLGWISAIGVRVHTLSFSSRYWSMIRRTTSPTVIPRRFASALRKTIWGLVRLTDLRVVLMNTTMRSLELSVKGVAHAPL